MANNFNKVERSRKVKFSSSLYEKNIFGSVVTITKHHVMFDTFTAVADNAELWTTLKSRKDLDFASPDLHASDSPGSLVKIQIAEMHPQGFFIQ